MLKIKEKNLLIDYIKNKLSEIILNNLILLKTGTFKVRPGYAYDKFYLDKIEGSYDESLQNLIHHIMFEDGIYKKILSKAQLVECDLVVKNEPENIYSPSGNQKDDQEVQELLDDIYWDCISYIGHEFLKLKIKSSVFKDYL